MNFVKARAVIETMKKEAGSMDVVSSTVGVSENTLYRFLNKTTLSEESYNLILDAVSKYLTQQVEKSLINKSEAAKPPLSLIPRWIYDRDRMSSVKRAIIRYHEANLEIPLDWIVEYNELVKTKR